MENCKRLKTCATAAAFLLIGAFGAAQTTTSARTLKSSEHRASGDQQRKNGAITHADYPRSADRTESGNAGGIDGGSNAAAHAAAHSNASSNGSNSSSKNVRTGENPLYEKSGNSGTNPLYESKDHRKPNAATSDSQSGPKLAADASRKHVAGVKYQNRTSAGQRSTKRSSTETFKQDFGQVQPTKR